jgi:hypothetical protein
MSDEKKSAFEIAMAAAVEFSEHGGFTPAPPIAPAPQWSTTPPVVTERPQFYWFRLGPGAKRIPVEVFELGGQSFCNTFGQIKKLSTSRDGGEWWPVRISDPPR